MMKTGALIVLCCEIAGASMSVISGLDEWASMLAALLRYAICELLARCPAPPPLPHMAAW